VSVVAVFSGWYLVLPAASALCFIAIQRHAEAARAREEVSDSTPVGPAHLPSL
jgi:hypothetical protein